MHEPLRTPYTYAHYSTLPEGAPYQLIGGYLVKLPSPAPYHQTISGRLFYGMMGFVMERGFGPALSAPLHVYFGERETCQPDLIYIAAGRETIIGPREIEEAPYPIAEILSPLQRPLRSGAQTAGIRARRGE
jgi:hypothetical protein